MLLEGIEKEQEGTGRQTNVDIQETEKNRNKDNQDK